MDDSLDDILVESNDNDNGKLPVAELTPPPGARSVTPAKGTPSTTPPPSRLTPPPATAASGPQPLPGLTSPTDPRGSDDDVTLIARLSLLDDLVEESTKVEPLETAKHAAASKEAGAPGTPPATLLQPPVGLADQASAHRDKALGLSPVARMSAAEFEDPGDDDDELTVSATPGIISISSEDEEADEEEDATTASQRPGGAATPAPVSGGPRLPTPGPPTGRPVRLPMPSGDLPPAPGFGPSAPPGPPLRSLTPALSIPAPQGVPAMAGARASVFNKVRVPLGGLVAFVVAAFGGGLVFGAWLWRGEAPAPVAASAQPLPAPTPPVAEPPPQAPPAPAAAAEPPPAPKEAAPPATVPAPAAVEPPVVVGAKPVRRVAAAAPAPKLKVVRKAPVSAPATGSKPTAAASTKTDTKADTKADTKKNWVDPFAQ